jgi:hypothetical protein
MTRKLKTDKYVGNIAVTLASSEESKSKSMRLDFGE